MKQRLFLGILGTFLTALFISCTGFFDLGNEEIKSFEDPDKPSTTLIYFNNIGGNYAVDVFSSHVRGNKIVSVPANGSSQNLSWVPTDEGFEFYLTYYLPVVPGKVIPFIPRKYSADYVTVVIPKDQITAVQVRLSPVIPHDEVLYDDDVWLAVKNNYASAIQLLSGNGAVNPIEGLNLVNNGVTAIYKLTPTSNVSGYTIMVQGNRIPLPSEIISFENGWLYEVEFNGTTAALTGSKLLTLDNL
jgi:hypothetical protein